MTQTKPETDPLYRAMLEDDIIREPHPSEPLRHGSAWELRELPGGDVEWSRSAPAPFDAVPVLPQPIEVPR